jgi:hypothetical protein
MPGLLVEFTISILLMKLWCASTRILISILWSSANLQATSKFVVSSPKSRVCNIKDGFSERFDEDSPGST